MDRETLGHVVRQTWVAWASEQEAPKASWLTPWEALDAEQREVDMRIGEAVVARCIDADRGGFVAGFVTLQQEMLDRLRAELAALRAALAERDGEIARLRAEVAGMRAPTCHVCGKPTALRRDLDRTHVYGCDGCDTEYCRRKDGANE